MNQIHSVEYKQEISLEKFKKSKQELKIQTVDIPDEMLLHIFNQLSVDTLKRQAFVSLFNCARVCKKWSCVVEERFLNFFKKITGHTEKPANMKSTQACRLLVCWKAQEFKLLTSSLISQAKFQPAKCRLDLTQPGLTFDKINLNGITIILGPTYLTAIAKKRALWHKKVTNPERRLLISTDQMLIATQHYYKMEGYHAWCRFDIRHVQTGLFLGKVEVLCPTTQKFFDETNVQFNLTQFIYRDSEDGKLQTRDYGSFISENCLE